MKEFLRSILKNKKPLLWGAAFVAVGLLLLGGNLISLVHNKIETHKLTRQNELLDKEYEELLHTQEQLEQQDPALLEKIARTKYNLAKPGEIEIRFPAP
ncbi:MAG: septum formation initiator family protein [Elusimicrobiaceae bacterium]|nr:septum formation initiator family protein [Elusimicrobiaceae bacterium]